ncbi:hypothetical protein ACIPR8_04025 [Stenotrophomonas sp. LARHCG68]
MQRTHAWKQAGTLVLWYYAGNDRNYPGWHLTADAEGGHSMIALLDALTHDSAPATRTLQITPPTAAHLGVPNNRAGVAWRTPGKLRLTFSNDPHTWGLAMEQDLAVLAFGTEGTAAIRDGLLDVLQGRGDYSITIPGGTGTPLWFWWWPRTAAGR